MRATRRAIVIASIVVMAAWRATPGIARELSPG